MSESLVTTSATSRTDSFLKKVEKVGDVLNAILVKETRQSLKSRQFVATFMLLLLSSWLISLFSVVAMGDSINYGRSGETLFQFYYFVLLVAVTVIVPFGAFRSMMGEKDHNTYDLLSITSLSPRQIVWGKLLSALLQVFIYYSAIAPFIAFTSLLEGFDLPSVAFMLGFGLLLSLGYSVVAIMLSTFANQRHWQGIMSILLLLGLLMMLGGSFSISSEIFMRGTPFDDPDFWWGVGIFLTIVLSYCWLFIQITTAQLTFESGNRSTGIRITSTLQQLVAWSLLSGYILYSGATGLADGLEVFTTFTIVHWGIIGLVAVTEENFLSRRLRKQLPKTGFYRAIWAMFLPGGSRGMAFILSNIAILVLFQLSWGAYFLGTSSSRADRIINYCVAIDCYLIIYLGLGCAFGRIVTKLSGEIRPIHVRVIVILAAVAGIIAPVIAMATDMIRWQRDSLLWITNPVMMLEQIYDRRSQTEVALLILAVTALVAILINVPAMIASIREIVKTEPQVKELEPIETEPFAPAVIPQASGDSAS